MENQMKSKNTKDKINSNPSKKQNNKKEQELPIAPPILYMKDFKKMTHKTLINKGTSNTKLPKLLPNYYLTIT
jgi:triosephosphate isomerase